MQADPAPPVDRTRPGVPWRDVARWATLGMLALLVLVMVDVNRHGGRNPVSLVQPGTSGPSARVFHRDFPDLELPDGPGLDGQQYYVIARDPLHPDRIASQLDNPRYRLQRPLLPWTAWLLHPSGGGTGLVWALALVGAVGIFGGALSTGVLTTTWGGPAWAAAVFPLLPGAYWSLRVTVSDALALALALAALAFAARDQHRWALAAAVLAVVAKEPIILVFVGWAAHRRTRRDAGLVVVPALVIVAWMAWLAQVLPPDTERAQDLGLPFVGLWHAWTDVWSHGRELVGMACTLGGAMAGVAALALRRLAHPLGWAIALQLVFLAVLGVNPASVNFGATRMAMPVMILALIALVTPRAARLES